MAEQPLCWWWWWTPTARSRSRPRAAGVLQPGGGHRPPPPGRHLYRGGRPQLPRALRLLRQRAGHRAAPVHRRSPPTCCRAEAEALLAGIVLDTKNFTMRTGGRTFEAAAFLRRAGADTAEVKKLFQNDLEGTIAKYAIIQNAQMYRDQHRRGRGGPHRGPDHRRPGRRRAAEHHRHRHLLCPLPRRGPGHHLRPLHGRHQRPGHSGEAGRRRQRRRRRRPGSRQDPWTQVALELAQAIDQYLEDDPNRSRFWLIP